MAVIECHYQFNLFRQEHAVTKHVTRHIADTRDSEWCGLRVVTE